jgi:hypothetical protein
MDYNPPPSYTARVEKHEADEPSHIAWHPAFIEALQLELEAYQNILQFIPEYQLTSEPLRIDCVVIKKPKDLVIKKNIGAIFRENNLLEYKSPDDYISVDDFYKVYGYACLYTFIEKASITGITISFVESRYPRELINHLREERGYEVEEKQSGIYIVRGDIIPIQIIDSSKLPEGENLWLKDLNKGLGTKEIDRIAYEVEKQGKGANVKAYLWAITQANIESFMEALKMSDSALTVEKVLEEAGLIAKWEARGEARGVVIGEARGEARGNEKKALAIAQNMINLGFPMESIISATELDPEKVKALYQS